MNHVSPVLGRSSKQAPIYTPQNVLSFALVWWWPKHHFHGPSSIKLYLKQVLGWSSPIGSMYDIFTHIYHKNDLNVGKYTSPMDPLGPIRPPRSPLFPVIHSSQEPPPKRPRFTFSDGPGPVPPPSAPETGGAGMHGGLGRLTWWWKWDRDRNYIVSKLGVISPYLEGTSFKSFNQLTGGLSIYIYIYIYI